MKNKKKLDPYQDKPFYPAAESVLVGIMDLYADQIECSSGKLKERKIAEAKRFNEEVIKPFYDQAYNKSDEEYINIPFHTVNIPSIYLLTLKAIIMLAKKCGIN